MNATILNHRRKSLSSDECDHRTSIPSIFKEFDWLFFAVSLIKRSIKSVWKYKVFKHFSKIIYSFNFSLFFFNFGSPLGLLVAWEKDQGSREERGTFGKRTCSKFGWDLESHWSDFGAFSFSSLFLGSYPLSWNRQGKHIYKCF